VAYRISHHSALAAIPADAFNALTHSSGAAGSYGRLCQLEQDPRWETRYVAVTDDDQLVSVIPLYRARMSYWPDPAYAPGTWLDDSAAMTPDQVVLVGGRRDFLTGLHHAAGMRLADVLSTIAASAMDWFGDDVYLALPFIFEPEAISLDAGSILTWRLIGHEARFTVPFPQASDLALPAKVRKHLRRDDRARARHGVVSEVTSWARANKDMRAARLIAEHNMRLGTADHEMLAEVRMSEWARLDDVELVAFEAHADSDQADGVVTALVWQDQLELFDIGLSGAPGEPRFAVYSELIFNAPFAFATRRGLRVITTGLATETAKAARGALLTPLVYGIGRASGIAVGGEPASAALAE
jgi:hypothetical protein